jgi:hypothetical protein
VIVVRPPTAIVPSRGVMCAGLGISAGSSDACHALAARGAEPRNIRLVSIAMSIPTALERL